MYDGSFDFDSLSSGQKLAALRDIPSYLEFLSFSMFPGSYFFGPLFSMKKFQDFIVVNQVRKIFFGFPYTMTTVKC